MKPTNFPHENKIVRQCESQNRLIYGNWWNKLFRDVFLFSAVVVEALSKTTENSDFVHSEPVFEEGWIWKGDHKLTVKTSSCKRF
jgi:hypothetical protein